MGFTEDIAKLSEQVRKRVDQVTGEEATKMALIVPFLSALGYDIYDPTEVMPVTYTISSACLLMAAASKLSR